MANPIFIDCPVDTWTAVATNVTTGQVWMVNTSPNKYLQTYRMTGDPAPTDKAEGVPAFRSIAGGISEQISNTAAIDVYIMALGVAGRVRVDL